METKKKIIAVVGILLVITVLLGVSYALWNITRTQESVNTITTGCLKIDFTDENPIQLEKTYPLTDEEGMKLTPYSFTLTNLCDSETNYGVSLETMEVEERLSTKYVAISFDNGAKQILGNLEETTPSYNKGDYTPIEGRKLTNGTLKANASVTHHVRLWLDESVTMEDDVMDKTFISKVVVSASPKENSNTSIAADYITKLAETSEELVYDETEDNNLRYIGANPNNYVTFNNELWRIIGVMNNITDSEGNTGSHIKIIRNESIGEYSWDNKPSGTGSSIDNYGSNDWSDGALMEVLNNGAYWNRTSGTCPSNQNGATRSCDFSTTGLTNEAKNMIANVVWNLGGSSTYDNVTASMFYERERGTEIYSGHAKEWTGKVGLMYPSDYGYATSGGSTTNRDVCLNTSLFNWNGSNVRDCKENDWLFLYNFRQWTLTSSSSYATRAFEVNNVGGVNYNTTYSTKGSRPVLYLNTKIEIYDGNGTEEQPYQIRIA